MKLKALALALVAAFALTACGSSNTAQPTVTVTETQSDTSGSSNTDTGIDGVYLATLHDLGNQYIDSSSDTLLIQIGHQVCDALDQGVTVYDLIAALANSGNFTTSASQEAVGYIIGVSVAAYCPQYTSQVQSL